MKFVTGYEAAIRWAMSFVHEVGPDKLMHTWCGLGFWLLAALVLRRPLRDIWPFWVVVGLVGANEVMDYIHGIGWTLRDTWWDIFATLFWPLVLMLALRWDRGLRR